MTLTSFLVATVQVIILLQDVPHAKANLTPRLAEDADFGCPPAADVDPCICTVDSVTTEINMDCSGVLDDAQLKQVFETDFLFPDLHTLTIVGTTADVVNIQKLDRDTFGRVSFSHVVISHTSLADIDTLAFNRSFSTIETMDFSNNMLQFFPFENLIKCEKLSEMRLSDNALEHMSNLHSETLTLLDISNNPGLRYEDTSFQTATNLEVINLSNTNLGHISPLTFAYQKQLKNLDLSNNKIDILFEDALKFVPSTPAIVNLSSNKISTVEYNAIKDWMKGSQLLLNRNMLIDLPEDVWSEIFITLEGDKTIQLDSNLIECACNIKWLVTNSTHMQTLSEGNECIDNTSIHDDTLLNFISNHC